MPTKITVMHCQQIFAAKIPLDSNCTEPVCYFRRTRGTCSWDSSCFLLYTVHWLWSGFKGESTGQAPRLIAVNCCSRPPTIILCQRWKERNLHSLISKSVRGRTGQGEFEKELIGKMVWSWSAWWVHILLKIFLWGDVASRVLDFMIKEIFNIKMLKIFSTRNLCQIN